MTNHHPQARYTQGLTTLDQEVVLDNLPVQGVMPTWLQGTLVRNGPAKFEAGWSAHSRHR